VSLSKSKPSFWYYLRNIKRGCDNSEFELLDGLWFDQIYGFVTFFCITRKNIFTCSNKNKLAKTEIVKEKLLTKQTLSRSQQNGY